MTKRVLVAMSGGVDSSVAAALLKEQGYQVAGATIQLWPDAGRESACSLAAVEDARRVASSLGIPFFLFNMQKEFQQQVIDSFIQEYKFGRTPNPCIQCNRLIKFGQLLSKAEQLGMDFIATGHYARIVREEGRARLLRGRDGEKDQSYFLYTLNQDKLKKILFPVGDYRKAEIRELAKAYHLNIADKPDSQEICFIPDNNYKEFLIRQGGLPKIPGDIVDTKGNVIGSHQGVFNYTIGQRRGLGVARGVPLYVVDINAETNTVVAGSNEEVLCKTFTAAEFNWIAGSSPEDCFRAGVMIRYNALPQPAVLTVLAQGRVRIEFDQPQRAIAPGQAAVVYAGEEVLGGGKILTRVLA
ncbi:MAG TPA: tRNA 2-thiouridine(34) synthase MnmA [Firmicutes bacterium]|nr:tRNA 2-thiouridine(34) synthase MnmA [Bacillota bacterium]HCX79214.1 tRNA 2-thiouridine(34) synthase MnmA [Bacillota bacterium]